MSNNAANVALNRVVVVPLSTQVSKIYPAEALITLNGEQRKAMADQITTASKKRLRNRMGSMSLRDMRVIEDTILRYLAIQRTVVQ